MATKISGLRRPPTLCPALFSLDFCFCATFFGFAAREGFLRFTFSDLTQKMTWGKDEASMVSAQGFSRQFSRKYSMEAK